MTDHFDTHGHRHSEEADDAHERFLIEEGLDLLGRFRAIKSLDARKAVIALVASLVDAELQAFDTGRHSANPQQT